MRFICEEKISGLEIKAEGFIVTIGRDDFRNLSLHYAGAIPHKLRRVLEKHKNLFVNTDLARTLICNEISHL